MASPLRSTLLGVILHTGDFKLDLTPVDGRGTDLSRIGAIASQQRDRLLLPTRRTPRRRATPSERAVGRVLAGLFEAHREKRLVVACFASHIHRVQQVAMRLSLGAVCRHAGASMTRNVAFTRNLGLLQIPEDRLIDIEKTSGLPPSQICVICTGSQGEPMSALSLMAAGENKWVKACEGDLVVLSSHAIPGTSPMWARSSTACAAPGPRWCTRRWPPFTSGHAMRDELKLLISIAKPRAFIPVHGEYRHLMHHARLATDLGVPAASCCWPRSATSSS